MKDERQFPKGGPGRRTYPSAGPRVGRIAQNVPPAQNVDGGRRTYNESLQMRSAQDQPHEIVDPKKRAGDRRREAPPLPENMLAGRNPIREALRMGRNVEKLYIANGDLSSAAQEILAMAREAGTVVQRVDRVRLDAMYSAHQGMLATVAPVPNATIEEILGVAGERGQAPFVIVLDGITDPHNLGAIIRTAECVGAHGVIIPERNACGLTPAVAKAAAGALEHIKIARVGNIHRAIDILKDAGVWVYGAAMDGEDVFETDLSGALALVIGSEGDGISRLTREKCDKTVALPMLGHLDSLNASVAAGVLMYQALRAGRA